MLLRWFLLLIAGYIGCFALAARGDEDDLPIVPDGFVVDVVAKEPMVSNPCVMAFDRRGRIFVGQGQQWRAPTPDTPGDRVDILIDDDDDGIADRRKTFAEGFNSIQGLAWKGRDLWIANAPDLTIVRDLDGDDEADEYVRVYTGLGNLEHSLHGLNFGTDGKLYMSKGNSKGYNRLDQLAPKAFRELWGLKSPKGAPDYTPNKTFKKGEYKNNYHTPPDDWGQQGGILRCDPIDKDGNYGRNLEIVSRGFRNPWDIAFDDRFNWLGTDNDQTQGDKIFAPFRGAHFGWGHSWSFHWTGEGHMPSVPASTPLFEGSGAGVIHYHAAHFPKKYRDAFYVNDWMRREIYMLRPKWDGALLKCEGGFPSVFARADGGRSLPASSGRVFEPTDIEVGPDGALYVLSWGHAYGATIKDGKQVDAGRVYRIRHKGSPLLKWQSAHRKERIDLWSMEQLFADLGSHVPAWRTDAQEELVRRVKESRHFLLEKLQGELTPAQRTWAMWTLGRIAAHAAASEETAPEDAAINRMFASQILSDKAHESDRIQSLRILAFVAREAGDPKVLPSAITQLLRSPNARLRHEAVQAIWAAKRTNVTPELIDLAARETDRITFYTTWNVLRDFTSLREKKAFLHHKEPGVRLAFLLALLEDHAAELDEVLALRSDKNERVAALAELWLAKTGGAEPLVTMSPPPGEYTEPVNVTLKTSVARGRLTYTLDGSTPVNTSTAYSRPITIDRNSTLKVAVARDHTQAGRLTSGEYRIRHVPPYRHRPFIRDLAAKSGKHYTIDWAGARPGVRHYTDRDYFITSVPAELRGTPLLRTANNDDRSTGDDLLSFTSDTDVTVWVGVDKRVDAPLAWMRVGEGEGFEDTGLEMVTTDPTFRLFKKDFPKGHIVLGGNTNHPANDSRRGHYVVFLDRNLLDPSEIERDATAKDVLAAMPKANAQRGRELFMHPRGAGCIKCHQMEGRGQKLAPDLSDIGSRAKKAEILIESILEPSAVITEGFAQQQVITNQGKSLSGAVLEETGRSLKLVDAEGKVTTILKDDIDERIGTKLSPMPAGFGKLMTAQQVADIVAWLLVQKLVGDRDGFSFRDQPERLEIHFGEQRIATYLKEHPRLTRRALVNVTTPGGVQVTRNFPPRKPEDLDPGYSAEDGIIHPVMHPGIWMGFGNVDGNDFWRLRAMVVFDGFVEAPAGDKKSGTFAVRNLFKSEDGQRTVCTEVTRYQFQRIHEGLILRLDAEYKSDQRDFYFGDQEESGLAVRVASPLRVQGGNGAILNDGGQRNAAAMWGKQAKWFDYFGEIDNRRVGVMVVSHPANPRPSWLHARDYGVVVTNPFPKQPKERREPYVKTWVKKGQTYRLSYAVLIHDLPADQPFDRTAMYRKALDLLKD